MKDCQQRTGVPQVWQSAHKASISAAAPTPTPTSPSLLAPQRAQQQLLRLHQRHHLRLAPWRAQQQLLHPRKRHRLLKAPRHAQQQLLHPHQCHCLLLAPRCTQQQLLRPYQHHHLQDEQPKGSQRAAGPPKCAAAKTTETTTLGDPTNWSLWPSP